MIDLDPRLQALGFRVHGPYALLRFGPSGTQLPEGCALDLARGLVLLPDGTIVELPQTVTISTGHGSEACGLANYRKFI